MKKLFVAVLAIAAAVACNTAEVVDLPQGPAIQFDNAFVQNATRVGTDTNTLEAFDVWAYIENKGGTLYEVGVDGIYHSVSAFGGTDTHVTGLIFNYLPSLGGHYIYCGGEKFVRAGGYSVRCCKE